MKTDTKENIQYITAIGTLFTGVLMCFLSFFLNEYEIETSVLMYFGQTLIFAGAVFGLNIVIKTKVLEAASKLKNEIDDQFTNMERRIESSKKKEDPEYLDPVDMKDL